MFPKFHHQSFLHLSRTLVQIGPYTSLGDHAHGTGWSLRICWVFLEGTNMGSWSLSVKISCDTISYVFHIAVFHSLTEGVVHIHLPRVGVSHAKDQTLSMSWTIHPCESPPYQKDRKCHASMPWHWCQSHHNESWFGEHHSEHGAHFMSISKPNWCYFNVNSAVSITLVQKTRLTSLYSLATLR